MNSSDENQSCCIPGRNAFVPPRKRPGNSGLEVGCSLQGSKLETSQLGPELLFRKAML
jgi:hypothetical protein